MVKKAHDLSHLLGNDLDDQTHKPPERKPLNLTLLLPSSTLHFLKQSCLSLVIFRSDSFGFSFSEICRISLGDTLSKFLCLYKPGHERATHVRVSIVMTRKSFGLPSHARYIFWPQAILGASQSPGMAWLVSKTTT